MAYTLSNALHRSVRLRQVIERENRTGTTIRLMRLKALLLKTQERLAQLLDGGQKAVQPIPALAKRGR